MKKVSIIMATFNRAHFIETTLLSIQNQTYTNFECLLIDDGSTDNTENVIAPFLVDKRFQYFKRSTKHQKGLCGCRNYGLSMATGSFIQFFDDDDYIHPQNLELTIQAIENYQTDFVHSNKQAFTTQIPEITNQVMQFKQFITKAQLYDVLIGTIGLASCTVLWKKECFEHFQFQEELHYAEEWELYSKILASGKNGVWISNILYYNRKHAQSNTGEYYNQNPIRKESHAMAIEKVATFLHQEQLLTEPIKRNFVQQALSFKEVHLFKKILPLLVNNTIEKWTWQLFYLFLPVKLKLYKLKRKLIQ